MKAAHNWKQILLGSVCKITTGKKDVNQGNSEGEFPFFTCSRWHTYSDSYSFDTAAILVAGNGEVGNLHYYQGKFEAYQRTYVLDRFAADIHYIFHYIDAFLKPTLLKNYVGSTIPFIKISDLTNFEIHIPVDNQEQTQIAAILSTIDKAIAQTEAIIAKQQRIKTGLMQDLLTRGIDEHGAIRTEATHAFKDSPLGRIPMEWEVETIGNVLSRPPKNGYSPQEAEGYTGIRMLGLGCLTIRGFEPVQLKNAPADDPRVSQAILRNGDFLISRSNTRDLVGLVGVYQDIGEPCMYSDLMVRLCFDQTVNTQYMEYVFRGYVIRSQLTNAATGTSSSMVKINATIIKNCVFAKPKFNEQGQILEILRKQADSLRKESACLANLRAVKTGLMQDMLTGKVRVTELINK